MKIRSLSVCNGKSCLWFDIAAFVIISLSCLYFTFNTISDFPYKKHAWANCDRYAIAMRYVDNDMRLLPAETYVMNHSAKFDIPYEQCYTPVDLPLYEYAGALILKITGTDSPIPLRVFYLLISIVGMFYLYKLMMLISENNFFISLVLAILALSSPTFIYYETGFVPGVLSIAMTFIGLYYYSLNYKNGKIKFFYISSIFLAVASLTRFPFLIIPIAITCIEGLMWIVKKRTDFRKWIALGIVYAFVGGMFLYNHYLMSKYGSMFLFSPLPVESFSEFKMIIKQSWTNWKFEYFTICHYVTFAFLIVVSVVISIVKRVKSSDLQRRYLLVVSVILLGELLYGLLMMSQFINHDYYFLDTFYIPVILLVGYFCAKLPKPNGCVGLILLCLIVLFVFPRSNAQNEKVQNNYWGSTANTYRTYKNYIGSDRLLDSLGINRDAKILVYNSFAPNLPFILMNRCGYVVDKVCEENVLKTLKWNYDYAVIHADFYDEMPLVYYYLDNYYDKIFENDRLIVYKNSVANVDSLMLWGDKDMIASVVGSDSICNQIAKNDEFYDFANFTDLELKGREMTHLKFEFDLNYFSPIANVFLIIKITDEQTGEIYRNLPLDDYFSDGNGNAAINLDEYFWFKNNEKLDKFQIYIHNVGKNELQINNFKVEIK